MNYILTDDITGKKYNLSWDKPIPPTKEDIERIFATFPERKVEPTPRISEGIGIPIDTSKPIIRNADGSISTERTITVGVDGKFWNIPKIGRAHV